MPILHGRERLPG